MRLTAKDVSDRLGMSYVNAAGLLAYLEDVGKAKVVEKRFAASGRGKPTRVYEVDQHTTIDFGADVSVAQPVVVEDASAEDHVAAALARLKAAQSEAA
jgi:predicted ArsR family transcriptional regulator